MREERHSLYDSAGSAAVTLRLRLLQTTDVHSNLLAHDYFTGREMQAHGLVRAATLIHQLRAQTPNCLLFDNGDFLQGTPLSDLIELSDLAAGEVHPAILAMNALGYDAATLGNHEFNFGLEWLEQALAAATFPVTCANLLSLDAKGPGETLFAPYLLLDRQFKDMTGHRHRLRIGVIGLTPPQVTTWDRHHLAGRVQSLDILETVRHHLPRMRAQGADLVIALAHSGIAPGPAAPMMENATLALGAIAGVDAILAGHTHEVFPSAHFADVAGISLAEGRLHGTPAVMAGSRGSHVGVLDLDLLHGAGGWRVSSARAEARPIEPKAPVDANLTRLLAPAHARAVRRTARVLGQTARPLHSYLALAAPSTATLLVSRAKTRAVERLLGGTSDAVHPVLAASAPFKTGGRGGPQYYTDVPPGPICLGHAADLYSFPNLLCAVRLTGAELRDWLERAAVVFNRITPGSRQQPLIDMSIPAHHFDMIDGLDYQIDVTQPARFDEAGNLADADAWRIRNLRFDGAPLDDSRIFILATNSYRAHGGGPFPATRADRILDLGSTLMRDVVADYIMDIGVAEGTTDPGRPHWSFRTVPETTVIYQTGPGLRRYPEEIAALGARDLGDSDAGFLRLELPLG